MGDFNEAYKTLVKYVDSVEAQAEVIRGIRKQGKGLEEFFGKSPDVRKCANEIEAEMIPRSDFLFEYVETFLEREDLSDVQRNYLVGIRERIFKYASEFEKPLLKVKHVEGK